MQLARGIILSALFLSTTVPALSQGFVNLNFEQAVVPSPPPTEYTITGLDWAVAAPGWSHSSGSDTAHVFYGGHHAGASQYYMLVNRYSPHYEPNSQLAGNYSMAFRSGVYQISGPDYTYTTAYISQTGTVPSSALSLRLLAKGPFSVFLSGTQLEVFSLGGNAYGANIPAGVAGTVAELKIACAAVYPDFSSETVVDNIQFSPTVVPEPSSLAFAGLGAAALAIFWRRRSAGIRVR